MKNQILNFFKTSSGKLIFYFLLGLFNCILCFIWTTYSYINFDSVMLIVLYLTSFISMQNILKRLVTFKSFVSKIGAKIGFFLILSFIAFQLIGNRGIIYPLNSHITIGRSIEFLCVCLWLFPILVSLIYFCDTLSFIGKSSNRYSAFSFYFVIVCLLLIPCLIYLIAFNPGISTYDTWECLYIYAHNIVGMPNWHPPFYVLFLKLIISICDSTYAVILVQIVLWILVWIEAISFLRNLGVTDKVLFIFSAFIGTSVSNCLNIISIWKDIPYTICLLLLTILLSKTVLLNQELTFAHYIKLIIALIGTFFFRQNGIVVYTLSVIVLVIAFRKSKKVLLSVGISVFLVLLIRFPLYQALQIDEQQMGGKYVGLGQDIVGTYLAGGEVSDDTLAIIDQLTNGAGLSYGYNPYYAGLSQDVDIPMKDFIICYIDTFAKNPRLMIHAILCRVDVIWDIMPGEDSFENLINYQGQIDNDFPEWNLLYPSFKLTPFYRPLSTLGHDSSQSNLALIIYWRTGIWLSLAIVVLYYYIIKVKQSKILLGFIPVLGQIIGLLLSTGWADFRYYWSVCLIFQFLLILLKSTCNNSVLSASIHSR